MHGAWQGLLANLAVVVAVVSVWANLRDPIKRLGRTTETIAFGLVMGGGALLAMALSFQVAPGMMFDLRVAPVAAAGLFGGPIAAILATAPALAYRVWLGGVGLPAGCLSLTVVATVAVLGRWHIGARQPRDREILAVAALAALGGFTSWTLMPPDVFRTALRTIAGPAVLFNVVGIVLAGLVIVWEERRRDLIASNALYRAIIEALPDCLNVKDKHGRFIAANPATARLMQAASPEALIGKTDFDFYPAATARRFREEELAAQILEQQTTVDQQAVFADGRTAWLSTLKVPFRDPDGRIVGLITHNRDITPTKLVQMELLKTRQQLSDALANMAGGLVLYDAEARIVLCNEQYRALFPLTADLRVTGAPLPAVLRESIARGEETLPPGLDMESWIAKVLAGLKIGGERVIGLADGRWVEVRTRPVADGGALTIFADVTARQHAELELQHRADHDPLTGLANRATFKARLADIHAQARSRRSECGVMLIDLDNFKQVNDTLGHGAGDRLLVEVARRLEAACRHGDVVARLGGDEFAILGDGIGLTTGFARMARRVLDELTRPCPLDGVSLLPSGSIGYSIFPQDPSEPDTLVTHADAALYAAKAAGRRRWVAYAPDDVSTARARPAG